MLGSLSLLESNAHSNLYFEVRNFKVHKEELPVHDSKEISSKYCEAKISHSCWACSEFLIHRVVRNDKMCFCFKSLHFEVVLLKSKR